jgi:hypothetical protein
MTDELLKVDGKSSKQCVTRERRFLLKSRLNKPMKEGKNFALAVMYT